MSSQNKFGGHDSHDRITYLSIIMEERSNAVGLAKPFPAISGAEPWTASKIDASWKEISYSPRGQAKRTLTLPMFPDGVRPKPPMRPAHMSDKMSPYKFGITMTRSE